MSHTPDHRPLGGGNRGSSGGADSVADFTQSTQEEIDADFLEFAIQEAVGQFGTPGFGIGAVSQGGGAADLLTIIGDRRDAGLLNIEDGGFVQYFQNPETPGLISVRGVNPVVDNGLGEATQAPDVDLGVFDITGPGGAEAIVDDLTAAGIKSQEIRDDVLQQNANTAEAAQIETARANTAREQGAAAGRALSASTAAMSAYLQGTQLADARRLAAHQEARALLPSLVSEDREFFAGTGPGGFLDRFSKKFLGGPTEGAEVIQRNFRPGDLAAGTSGIQSAVEAGVADIKAQA